MYGTLLTMYSEDFFIKVNKLTNRSVEDYQSKIQYRTTV